MQALLTVLILFHSHTNFILPTYANKSIHIIYCVLIVIRIYYSWRNSHSAVIQKPTHRCWYLHQYLQEESIVTIVVVPVLRVFLNIKIKMVNYHLV